MKSLIFSFAAGLALSACATVQSAPTPKAFVIRHFEKEAGSDPALTAVGQANATRLAQRLSGERIAAIHSTDTRRTRDSAAPTASKFGLTTSLYPPTDYAALADRVAAHGGNVLIVGHSNTVPDIVARLSGVAQPAMDESQYGTLFVIDLATKAVTTERIGD